MMKQNLFSTAKELKEYWEKDENFERLKNQDYGKLNMLYTYKIVLIIEMHFQNY